MLIPKHVKTEALESLVATLNFIEFFLKMLDHYYEVRCGMYNKSMKQMFKQIPTTMSETLSPEQKVQKLMT